MADGTVLSIDGSQFVQHWLIGSGIFTEPTGDSRLDLLIDIHRSGGGVPVQILAGKRTVNYNRKVGNVLLRGDK